MTTNYETRRQLRKQTLAVGRQWSVVSVPGREGKDEPTLWFVMNRRTNRSNGATYSDYDSAFVACREKNLGR